MTGGPSIPSEKPDENLSQLRPDAHERNRSRFKTASTAQYPQKSRGALSPIQLEKRASAKTRSPLSTIPREETEGSETARTLECQESFLHLQKIDGKVLVRGTPSCSLGHKLRTAPDRPPDGVFVDWTWDGKRLEVRNDRYGFYPLFYFSRANEICISPSIPRLLDEGAPSAWDDPAMAVFLRMGYFIGEDTPFRGVRALPPAATLVWEDGRLRVSGGSPLVQEQDMVRKEAIDTYIALFRQAVRRRVPPDDEFAVPLSGGRDSRHILLELCALGYRPRVCITMQYFPPRSSQEVETAGLLAQTLDVPHVVLPQGPSWLDAELRKNLATSFCADEHAWMLPMADYLKGKVNVLYDGIGGSALTGYLNPKRLALFNANLLPELCHDLFYMREKDVRGLLRPTHHRRWNREIAMEHIITELRRHQGAPNPSYSFFFWNKVRREIALAPFGILSDIGTIFCPYLDYDLYEFFASIPGRNLLDQEFHDQTIRRAYPRYADIPFEPVSPPPGQNPVQLRRFVGELAKYLLIHRPSSEIIRPQFLLPRLIRSFLDGDATSFNLMHSFGVYLKQLEGVTA